MAELNVTFSSVTQFIHIVYTLQCETICINYNKSTVLCELKNTCLTKVILAWSADEDRYRANMVYRYSTDPPFTRATAASLADESVHSELLMNSTVYRNHESRDTKISVTRQEDTI